MRKRGNLGNLGRGTQKNLDSPTPFLFPVLLLSPLSYLLFTLRCHQALSLPKPPKAGQQRPTDLPPAAGRGHREPAENSFLSGGFLNPSRGGGGSGVSPKTIGFSLETNMGIVQCRLSVRIKIIIKINLKERKRKHWCPSGNIEVGCPLSTAHGPALQWLCQQGIPGESSPVTAAEPGAMPWAWKLDGKVVLWGDTRTRNYTHAGTRGLQYGSQVDPGQCKAVLGLDSHQNIGCPTPQHGQLSAAQACAASRVYLF